MASRRMVLLARGLASLALGGVAIAAAAPPGRGAAPASPRPPATPPVGAARPAAGTAYPNTPPPGNEIMRVSEVRPGMRGYGLTVFRGTRIEGFGVEVIDIMPRANLGQPLVLVKLDGGPITGRGAFLIQGMSGSPVYLNGKLLGAFSQGYIWPKDPLGMVTPIEDMLEALDPKLSQVPAGSDVAFTPSGDDGSTAGLFRAPEPLPDPRTDPARFGPLSLPVQVSGLSPRLLEMASRALRPFNLAVTQGPGAMTRPFKAVLEPGAALGVALMTGDIDMTAIGTVTYRNGDDILAFGHPFLGPPTLPAGIGAAQFPISTAYIQDVFSGFQTSHKIGSPGKLCGATVHDRPFSISARVGAPPPMVPIHCSVTDRATGRKGEFNVQTTTHPLLVGQLVPMAVGQAVFNVRPVPGDTAATIEWTVETDGAGVVRRLNRFYDPFGGDLPAVLELQELMSLLGNNPHRRIPVKSVDVHVTLEQRRPTATIERIFVGQDRFEPGEEIEIGVMVRPHRREPVLLRSRLKIPETAAEGRAVLLVHGGGTRVNLTTVLGAGSTPGGPPAAAPTPSLENLIRRFAETERNDQLVSRLVFPSSAVSVNGEKLSRLPSPLVNIMRSTRSTGLRLERDESHSELDTDYVLTGLQTLAVNIQKQVLLEKPAGRPGGGGPATGPSGPPLGSGPAIQLQAGDGFDDLSILRFTVDGKPFTIRLTPEIEERAGSGSSRQGSEAGTQDRPGPSRPAGAGAARPAAPKEAAPSEKPVEEAEPAVKLIGRAAGQWQQSSAAEFAAGIHRSTAVGSLGEVRLAPTLRLAHTCDEQFVWSLAARQGALFAGTGSRGEILRLNAEGKSDVFFRTKEIAVHALAFDRNGNLLAGTSPRGRLYRIGPDGKGEVLFSLDGGGDEPDGTARFVLSLAAAPDGTVYAGTGPDGRIYRVPAEGAAELVCSLPGQSIGTLHVSANGFLYAGAAETGAVYRVPLGAGSQTPQVVFDTEDAAITGLATDLTGQLYAACYPSGQIWRIPPEGAPVRHYRHSGAPIYGLLSDAGGVLYTSAGNAVLRIEPDGSALAVTDAKRAQFTGIYWDDQGRIVLSGANVGCIYRLEMAREGVYESTVLDARVPASWGRIRLAGIIPPGGVIHVRTRSGDSSEPDASWSPWADPLVRDGGSYVQSPPARFLQYQVTLRADNGSPSLREIAIAYLPRNQRPVLTLISPAPGVIVRGRYTLKWSAEDPDKDTLTYQVFYSGNNGQSWTPVGAAIGPSAAPSPGQDPQGRPTRAGADEALRRYREQLEKDAGLSPAQRDESFNKARDLIDQYFAENPEKPGDARKPEAAPAPRAAAGPPGPPGVTRQATLNWDTREVPDGIYLLRIVASDRAANPSDPQSDERVSEPFLVSNTPPQIFLFERGIRYDPATSRVYLSGLIGGRVTIRGAQYRIGKQEWQAIDAADGIWDSAMEQVRLEIAAPGPGDHQLEVQAQDAAGNAETVRVKLTVPGK